LTQNEEMLLTAMTESWCDECRPVPAVGAPQGRFQAIIGHSSCLCLPGELPGTSQLKGFSWVSLLHGGSVHSRTIMMVMFAASLVASINEPSIVVSWWIKKEWEMSGRSSPTDVTVLWVYSVLCNSAPRMLKPKPVVSKSFLLDETEGERASDASNWLADSLGLIWHVAVKWCMWVFCISFCLWEFD